MTDRPDTKKKTGYIISHTHWDREWRYPIWKTNILLVKFFDELIELIEKGDYPGFLMDGQVSPMLDYLEIRPQMKDRMTKLVRDGKLQIGPWYTLPDEYPVDGEAMVRNLLKGIKESDALGGAFKVAYTPFGWGQTAQLPQIYAGFGMDICLVGKKVNKHRAPNCEFIWRAPDGSELITTRFGEWGRQNFFFKIHLTSLFGTNHEGSGWVYDVDVCGPFYHRADYRHMEQDYFLLQKPDRWYPEMINDQTIEAVWKTLDESLLPDDRIMMNGCDYSAGQPLFPKMLEELNKKDPDKKRQWVHTTIHEYIKLLRTKLDRSALKVVQGELRDGPAEEITGNALTTRLYIKQLNKKAQNLLIRQSEPLCAVTAIAMLAPYETPYFDRAWKYLLDSHPHDSINGVTQDKTADDVVNRLEQVIEISNTMTEEALQAITKNINLSGLDNDEVAVVVFNPLPYERAEVIEAWVDMPIPRGQDFWPPNRCWIEMFDAKKNPIGVQSNGFTQQAYSVSALHTRSFPYRSSRYKVFFDTGTIPACGYKVFTARLEEPKNFGRARHLSYAIARTDTLLAAPDTLENEYLKVKINSNGTFDLTDKTQNRTFFGLNYYEDRGEIGDYWNNERPVEDKVFTSLGAHAKIWSEDSGAMSASLVSQITMSLPQSCIRAMKKRSDTFEDLTIRTRLTLQKGARQLEINVEFENRHQDHVLRAMFPTGISDAKYADTGGHFIVDRRPIRPTGPSDHSIWPDMATLPHNNFIDVSDNKTGLAFLNDCLTEYEVLDNSERTVALSLLRSVRDWICTELRVGSTFESQKGGQCLGKHALRYWIRPHQGDWQSEHLPLEGFKVNVPCIPIQTNRHKGTLPADEKSFFRIDNDMLCFSALKPAQSGNGWIVRIYNPTQTKQKTNLRFSEPVKMAWEVALSEKQGSPLEVSEDGGITVLAEPYKIVNINILV